MKIIEYQPGTNQGGKNIMAENLVGSLVINKDLKSSEILVAEVCKLKGSKFVEENFPVS
jgi:hypothetical protein